MIPPSLKPGSHTGRDKFDGTRKTPRAPEKSRRACRKNGAMLHRDRLGVGRSSVAHNPRPAETTQRPLGTLRSYEHATTYRRWLSLVGDPSPCQKSISENSDCGIKSEQGALGRGSDVS